MPSPTQYRLRIAQEAEEDLDELGKDDPDSAADVWVALQELCGDQDMLDNLLAHGYQDDEYSVSKWLATWKGRDPYYLWRLKLMSLESLGIRLRIVYLFDAGTRTFWVLSILPRSWDYDPSSEKSRRIFAAADRVAPSR